MVTNPMQTQHDSDLRIVRSAILNSVPIPAQAAARLEARGINVGALEIRIRQQFKTGDAL